jgi:FkbM family methyltransferase
LRARASKDADWETFNFALGDAEGEHTINISRNSFSSSILEMLPAHEAAAPESRYVGAETISVRTLDGIFDDVCPPGTSVYLKVDTQGYEGRVLRGARRSLSKIDVVQLEMPVVPLYDGELTLIELLELMRDEGYVLVALDPGFTDPRTGYILQVDGAFRRAGEPESP